MADLLPVRGHGVEKSLLQAFDGAQPLLRDINAAPTGQQSGNDATVFSQCLAQRRGEGFDDTTQRLLCLVEGFGYGLFESLQQRVSDRVDQLLFARKPPVDASDRDTGVFRDPGDRELFGSVIDQDVLGRSE